MKCPFSDRATTDKTKIQTPESSICEQVVFGIFLVPNGEEIRPISSQINFDR